MKKQYLIKKGVVRHIWPKVSVKGHVGEVLGKLVELNGYSTIRFFP